jgi:Flp pilus assembly protein TadG
MMINLTRRRSRRGVAAVEFALTFPVVALLLLGGLEFGWYFSRLAMVNSAAYDSARYGATLGSTIQQRVGAQAAATTMLGDLGFDCGTPGTCVANANIIVTAAGTAMVELDLDVTYIQLTGLIPVNDSTRLFEAPDRLRARAVATVVSY